MKDRRTSKMGLWGYRGIEKLSKGANQATRGTDKLSKWAHRAA
jgi:hypothetical protein